MGKEFAFRDEMLIQTGNIIQLVDHLRGLPRESVKLQCGNWTRGTELRTQGVWWIPDGFVRWKGSALAAF